MKNLRTYEQFNPKKYLLSKDEDYERKKIIDKRLTEIQIKEEIKKEIDFLKNQKILINRMLQDIHRSWEPAAINLISNDLMRIIDRRINKLNELLKKL